MALATVQQQQIGGRDGRKPTVGDPWEYWTPQHIAWAASVPIAAVIVNHPLIVSDLHIQAINTQNVQAAAIATIAIETASTYRPVRESFWLDDRYGYEWAEEWRRTHLPTSRYWPYYGRGFVQLTWESNYREEGNAIGQDLVSIPDLALEAWIASDALARFFLTHGVADAAEAQNWPEVRRRVQGGYASLDRLERIIANLGV